MPTLPAMASLTDRDRQIIEDLVDPYHAKVAWLPILEYRDFHDVPRLILLSVDERFLLLDCPFDEVLDDYPPDYDVYELDADPRRSVAADWRGLAGLGRTLGRVPVGTIAFDPTRREAINADGLAPFLR
jgi:hypothetical protein